MTFKPTNFPWFQIFVTILLILVFACSEFGGENNKGTNEIKGPSAYWESEEAPVSTIRVPSLLIRMKQ